MAERLGLLIRRFPVRFSAVPTYVVSLGNALHPTSIRGMSLYLLYVALDKSVCLMIKC